MSDFEMPDAFPGMTARPVMKPAHATANQAMLAGGAAVGAGTAAWLSRGAQAAARQRLIMSGAGVGGMVGTGAALINAARPDAKASTVYETAPTERARLNEVSGFANSRIEADDIDRQIALESWMRANPTASAAAAGAVGAVDAASFGAGRTFGDIFHPSAIARFRANHPFAYRAGQYGAAGGLTAINPWLGASAAANALMNEPAINAFSNGGQ